MEDLDGSPRRRGRRVIDEKITDNSPAVSTEEMENDATEAAVPEVEAQPMVEEVTRDIGLWKHGKWSGRDVWEHARTKQCLFDERVVKRRRRET